MSEYLQRYVTSGQSHRAPCQFFEFTRDNLANQILKRSLRELRRLATLLPLPPPVASCATGPTVYSPSSEL